MHVLVCPQDIRSRSPTRQDTRQASEINETTLRRTFDHLFMNDCAKNTMHMCPRVCVS